MCIIFVTVINVVACFLQRCTSYSQSVNHMPVLRQNELLDRKYFDTYKMAFHLVFREPNEIPRVRWLRVTQTLQTALHFAIFRIKRHTPKK